MKQLVYLFVSHCNKSLVGAPALNLGQIHVTCACSGILVRLAKGGGGCLVLFAGHRIRYNTPFISLAFKCVRFEYVILTMEALYVAYEPH